MESKICVSILFLFPFFAYVVQGQGPATFDITNFGAKPDAEDISKALLGAWNAALNSTTPSTIVIPQGTWNLLQVTLLGPNKAPIELKVQGTLKAYSDHNLLPNKTEEWITINYVNFFTLSGGGVFDGMGQEAWKLKLCREGDYCAELPQNLNFNFMNNSIIHDITSKDSKSFQINCVHSSNVTFERVTIIAPDESPNTDGIHLGRDTMINITNSVIQTGDDCVSIGDESKEIHIQNVTCGPGHGISIGSLGRSTNEKDVQGIYIKNCSFTSTMNGVRVKTWPSSPSTLQVSDLHFEDIIMNNVSNPIIIDQEYCPWNQCNKQNPSLIKISKMTMKNIRGTSFTKEAVTLACSSKVPCENVEIGDIDLTYNGNQGPITTVCQNVQPTFVGKQNPPVCAPNAAAPKAP